MEGEEIKPTKVSICYCSTRYIKAEEGELLVYGKAHTVAN